MKLYVGNLGDEGLVTSGDLRPLFERYGKVTECEVIKNYAFVHMESENEATEAVKSLNGTSVKGRNIKVEKSESKGPRRPSTKLFVGNLAEGTTNEQLFDLFNQYAPVIEADVIKNFGFVHIDADASKGKIQEILRELSGYNLNGNKIRVQQSTSGVRQKPGMGGDTCYRCGREGHWSKECPQFPDHPPSRDGRPYGGRGGSASNSSGYNGGSGGRGSSGGISSRGGPMRGGSFGSGGGGGGLGGGSGIGGGGGGGAGRPMVGNSGQYHRGEPYPPPPPPSYMREGVGGGGGGGGSGMAPSVAPPVLPDSYDSYNRYGATNGLRSDPGGYGRGGDPYGAAPAPPPTMRDYSSSASGHMYDRRDPYHSMTSQQPRDMGGPGPMRGHDPYPLRDSYYQGGTTVSGSGGGGGYTTGGYTTGGPTTLGGGGGGYPGYSTGGYGGGGGGSLSNEMYTRRTPPPPMISGNGGYGPPPPASGAPPPTRGGGYGAPPPPHQNSGYGASQSRTGGVGYGYF